MKKVAKQSRRNITSKTPAVELHAQQISITFQFFYAATPPPSLPICEMGQYFNLTYIIL